MSRADILGFDFPSLSDRLRRLYGAGDGEARALLGSLYRGGTLNLHSLPDFRGRERLAREIEAGFSLRLPEIRTVLRDGESLKLLLRYPDGAEVESVLLFMRSYASLCLSSQVGCGRGCRFCRTGELGLRRNLTAGEIVAQYLCVRFLLGYRVRNLVFMGMGEPFDNYDAVAAAIRVFSEQRGAALPASGITLSTAGHIPGIERLASEIRACPQSPLARVRLAVSLHTPDQNLRAELMPIARLWPLDALRESLAAFPLRRSRDRIFFEYTLIPGINDSPGTARRLGHYLTGLKACVNLIPWNPTGSMAGDRPGRREMEAFADLVRREGLSCRLRDLRGAGNGGACGELGGLVARNRCIAARTTSEISETRF